MNRHHFFIAGQRLRPFGTTAPHSSRDQKGDFFAIECFTCSRGSPWTPRLRTALGVQGSVCSERGRQLRRSLFLVSIVDHNTDNTPKA
jgi:hypothetical protein